MTRLSFRALWHLRNLKGDRRQDLFSGAISPGSSRGICVEKIMLRKWLSMKRRVVSVIRSIVLTVAPK